MVHCLCLASLLPPPVSRTSWLQKLRDLTASCKMFFETQIRLPISFEFICSFQMSVDFHSCLQEVLCLSNYTMVAHSLESDILSLPRIEQKNISSRIHSSEVKLDGHGAAFIMLQDYSAVLNVKLKWIKGRSNWLHLQSLNSLLTQIEPFYKLEGFLSEMFKVRDWLSLYEWSEN